MKSYLIWCVYISALDGVSQTLRAAGLVTAVTSSTLLAVSAVVHFIWAGLGVYFIARGTA